MFRLMLTLPFASHTIRYGGFLFTRLMDDQTQIRIEIDYLLDPSYDLPGTRQRDRTNHERYLVHNSHCPSAEPAPL